MILEIELPDHPDYLLLKKVVGAYAMEALVRIWGHCQSNKRGERWWGKGADYVEVIARWDGERGVLFTALVDYGWIEVSEGWVNINNWESYNASLLTSRKNGKLGGRPAKALPDNTPKPGNNPQVNPDDNNSTSGLSPLNNGGSIEIADKPTSNPQVILNANQVNPRGTRPVVSNLIVSPPSGGTGGSEAHDESIARSLVATLNQLTGAKFNPPLHELDAILGRLLEVNRDGPGIEKMLRRQVTLWRHDPRMRNNLKPGTLFGANFHDYYGQREQPIAPVQNGKTAGPERGEMLQTLAATRREMEKLPPASAHFQALQSEIETLEAQLA